MGLFLPKQVAFFDLMVEVSDSLIEMVELLDEFSKNFKDFEKYSVRAKEIESQADQKTHAIIDKLNKTFITPIDREDIYLLAHELDDIVDLVESIIQNVHLYKITNKIDAFGEFVPVIKAAGYYLKELLLAFQKQKYSEELLGIKIKIHELEDQADVIFAKSISKLFTEEKDPINVIKFKDILENMENTMDKFQKVADIIEGILVKST
ncbi:MAG: DUF47 family protein [Candidatus Peregrinibacteria bacterium]|nr:DUF47 family protein [Candidatus Peregrinibacteria bacterium]